VTALGTTGFLKRYANGKEGTRTGSLRKDLSLFLISAKSGASLGIVVLEDLGKGMASAIKNNGAIVVRTRRPVFLRMPRGRQTVFGVESWLTFYKKPE